MLGLRLGKGRKKWTFRRIAKNFIPSLRENGVRRFADPKLGRAGLFRELNDREVRYVALRWFEDVPEWPSGEDIDLLIEADDFGKIDDLFVTNDRSIPCDLYGTRPIENACWKGLAYYPPHLADQIVSSRRLYRDICFIPDEEHYFLSLAFHAIYHKGDSSGLPWDEQNFDSQSIPPSSSAEHAYEDILRSSIPSQWDPVPLNVKGLHEWMHQRGWAPPIDTLRKYATLRPELQDLLPPAIDNRDGDLMVFLFRESAVKHELVDEAIQWLQRKHRLELVTKHTLSASEIEAASLKIRGGNWGRGPFATSGGLPAVAAVFFDFHPLSPGLATTKQYPHLQNQRSLLKLDVRKRLNRSLDKEDQTNCLHGSDDQLEAVDYLSTINPELEEQVTTTTNAWRRSYRTHDHVIRSLRKLGNRSKIELIERNGRRLVKKTFRPSFARFFERELFIHQSLSDKLSTIPPILESDEFSFITPYHENRLAGLNLRQQNRLLRPYAREIFEVLESAYQMKHVLIDYHPGNIILTGENRVFVVDFEFAQPFAEMPSRFIDCPDLTGLPQSFDGDRPCNLPPNGYRYEDFWKPIFRKPLETLLEELNLSTTLSSSGSYSKHERRAA